MNNHSEADPASNSFEETMETVKKLIVDLTTFYIRCNQEVFRRIMASPELDRRYQETLRRCRNPKEIEKKQGFERSEEPLAFSDDEFSL